MGQGGLCFGAAHLINREDNARAGCLRITAAGYQGSESAPSSHVGAFGTWQTKFCGAFLCLPRPQAAPLAYCHQQL